MPIYENPMGNPFVDAGICSISEWLNKIPSQITNDDLKKVVRKVAPIYVDNSGFKKNLYSIFFNSKLVNPSVKGDRKKIFIDECNKCIASIEPLQSFGDCLGCGRRTFSHKLGRNKIPLTGSGELMNFFPSFDSGVGYCSACVIAIQLSPLSYVTSGGKFLMMSSNSWQVMKLWTKSCIENIRSKILKGEDVSCYNPGYSNPRNGLFHMASEMIKFEELDRIKGNTSMQVFYFTNFGQTPELEIFYLPAPVFNFLRYANQSEYKFSWTNIVRSGYQVNWDKVESEEDYKNKQNLVYEYLLRDISIIKFFVNLKERKNRGNWELLTLYLKEIQNMNEERIEAIKEVADKIAEYLKKSGKDKRLFHLENAKSYGQFQRYLLSIVKDRLKLEEDKPLFTLDEYLKYLFPISENGITYWKETRYLLLFRIYEQLHEWLKDKEVIDYEIDENLDEKTEEN